MSDCGIKEAFCKLCSISIKHIDRNSKFSLINNMLSLLTGLRYTYIWHDSQEINIRLMNGMTINDVLWLYYGARCIIAHGKPTKTMSEGSLMNFLLFYCWQLGIWPVQLQSGSRVQTPLWRVEERSEVHQVGIPRAYRDVLVFLFIWWTAWWWVLQLHWITPPQRSLFYGTTRDISCPRVGHSDSITTFNFTHAAVITFHIHKKMSLCNDQGLSAVLSTWECYVDVVDILTESFDILI